MSDFDKEAERERLREKYEQDRKKREASERMSDLLLKGATMTNAHCNNCGDPIFRYDGDEFCPTCQQVVTEDEAAEAATDQTATETATHEGDAANGTAPEGGSSDHIEIKQPDAHTAQSESEQPAGTATDRSADPASGQNQPGVNQPAGSSEQTRDPTGASAGDGQPSPSAHPSPTQQTPEGAPSSDGSGDFEAAHASLVRTLRSHAERAEQCEDTRRARDHLAAAREAAEALSALSGSY